jgi:hypothetical protein
MSKIHIASDKGIKHYQFLCPGCNKIHGFNSTWKFNNDLDNPTVSPSLLVDKDKPENRCHSFITDGKIKFLNDSHHDLKGQTVELPDIDEWFKN